MTLAAAPPEAQPTVRDHPVAIGDVFGWLTPGQAGRGVLLCGTYGYEQHCAHRSWRALAHHIAATGCATLRFDYPGTGDSGDAAPRSLEAWVDAIRRAARFLRDAAEVEAVTLVGLRLGGTLAARAAEDLSVDRLVLLAPFVTGQAYIREMSLQARMIDVRPNGDPMPARPGVVSAGGFALDPPLLADLAALDLIRSERAPAGRILVLGPERGGLVGHYRNLGAEVTAAPFPDLAQLCANSMNSRCSAPTMAAIAAFASGQPAQPPSRRMTRGVAPARIDGPHWREEPVRFGHGATGILCRPPGGATAATVLFLNMGLDVHTGFARQTTGLARDLARDGIRSLRIDLRGVGDSAERPDGPPTMYDLKALDDVAAAVDLLAAQPSGPLIVTGTCHGAYLAFHAACRDVRVDGAVLVNLYCFDWSLAHCGVPYAQGSVRTFGAYLAVAKQGQAWRRILDGRTSIRRIGAAVTTQGLRAMRLRLARVFRGRPDQAGIPERIARLRKRGAHLALLYSADDLGLVDLHRQLGTSPSDHARTLGRPVRIVPDADHAFSAAHARAELLGTLMEVAASSPAPGRRTDSALEPPPGFGRLAAAKLDR